MILDRRRYGSDNYVYLLAEGTDAALVDPGDPVVAMGLAAAHGVRPGFVLHTHGHPDHSGGSETLRRRLGARVLGHGADAGWFAPDEDLAGRAEVRVGALRVRVHAAPGHTPGSVLLECGGNLLTGDTLFWAGCGNCRSGGDPAVLARTFLGLFPALPGTLAVHPGHDYAERNLEFVLRLEPGNEAARARLAEVKQAREAGREPEPSTLERERAVNPFLRAPDEAAFVALRRLRDAG